MKFETFKEILKLNSKVDEFLDKSNEIGLDFAELPLTEAFWSITNLFLESEYTTVGTDWIFSYIYEKDYLDELPFECSLEGLWNYIEVNHKSE